LLQSNPHSLPLHSLSGLPRRRLNRAASDDDDDHDDHDIGEAGEGEEEEDEAGNSFDREFIVDSVESVSESFEDAESAAGA
jgi:hypothetical protein